MGRESDFTQKFPKNSFHLVSSGCAVFVCLDLASKNSGWFHPSIPPTKKKSCIRIPSLKLTVRLRNWMNWKTFSFPLGFGLFSGAFAASFRECFGKNAFFCIAKRHCLRRFVCQPIAFAKAPPWPWFIGARQVPAMVEQGPCSVHVLLAYFYQHLSIKASNRLRQNTILYR